MIDTKEISRKYVEWIHENCYHLDQDRVEYALNDGEKSVFVGVVPDKTGGSMIFSDGAETNIFSIIAQLLLYTGTYGSPLLRIFKNSRALNFVRTHIGGRVI